jgi:exodeoxyribonuclease VII large subunit
VPVREDLLNQVGELALRSRRAAGRPLMLGRERLEARAERLPAPETILAQHAQKLDDLGERLRRGLGDRRVIAREKLDAVARRLSAPLLLQRIANERRHIASSRLDARLLHRRLQDAARRFEAVARVLPQLDPDKPLDRGFARVVGAQGGTVMSKERAAGEPSLTLKFRDGDLTVVPGTVPRKAKRQTGESLQQGDLF